MKTWIGTLIPAVVASVVVVAAVGVAQDKTSVLKGTRDRIEGYPGYFVRE